MRNTLYRQMVYCINAYRTWIEVADDNLYKEHIISRTDRTDYLVSRTLVLRASRRTAYTPRVRHGLFPNTNWTRLWPSTESKTLHSSSASRKRPCTFRPRMPKPLSGWQHTALSNWNSLCVPLPYPKSPITYVTEYPATHFLRDTFRGIHVIVQEQQAVHGNLLHGNGTKRQRP